jgi:hypothetical protein
LGKKKKDLNEKLAVPGSINLAAKSGNMTVEAMKILQISAGTMKQHQASNITD